MAVRNKSTKKGAKKKKGNKKAPAKKKTSAKKKTKEEVAKKKKTTAKKSAVKKPPKGDKKKGKKGKGMSESKAKRKLGKLDAQAAKDWVDKYQYSDFPDIPWYNFDEGTHKIRVLPPWREDIKSPGIAVHRHWSMPDPDDHSRYTSLVCPEKSFPQSDIECPVCEKIRLIEDKTGIEIKRERAGMRVYANIVVRAKRDPQGRKLKFEDEDTKVWVCGMPTSVFNQVMKLSKDPDVGDVTDIEEGFDLNIERTGSGLNTEYDVRLVPKPKPLFPTQEEIDEAIEQILDLDEIFIEPDEDYQKRLADSAELLERKYIAPDAEHEYEEDDDEEEAEEDDSEDEGEEEEEADDEEEAEDDDDDDEEEVEDDDDEEGEEEEEDEEEDEGDDEDDDEEEEEEEEHEPSEDVETPDEAIKALGLKALKTQAAKDAVEVGAPKCYGQYPKVAKPYREVCDGCAYEYPCAEDSGLEGPYEN